MWCIVIQPYIFWGSLLFQFLIWVFVHCVSKQPFLVAWEAELYVPGIYSLHSKVSHGLSHFHLVALSHHRGVAWSHHHGVAHSIVWTCSNMLEHAWNAWTSLLKQLININFVRTNMLVHSNRHLCIPTWDDRLFCRWLEWIELNFCQKGPLSIILAPL